MKMSRQDIINFSNTVIEKSSTAILTTIDYNNYPDTRAMLNLRNPDKYPGLKIFFNNYKNDLILYFTTNTSSSKIKQIQKKEHCSVFYCLPDNWQSVQLKGFLEIITDIKLKKDIWQPDWNIYYPEGPDDLDYTILKFTPLSLKAYNQLSIYTYNFESNQ